MDSQAQAQDSGIAEPEAIIRRRMADNRLYEARFLLRRLRGEFKAAPYETLEKELEARLAAAESQGRQALAAVRDGDLALARILTDKALALAVDLPGLREELERLETGNRLASLDADAATSPTEGKEETTAVTPALSAAGAEEMPNAPVRADGHGPVLPVQPIRPPYPVQRVLITALLLVAAVVVLVLLQVRPNAEAPPQRGSDGEVAEKPLAQPPTGDAKDPVDEGRQDSRLSGRERLADSGEPTAKVVAPAVRQEPDANAVAAAAGGAAGTGEGGDGGGSQVNVSPAAGENVQMLGDAGQDAVPEKADNAQGDPGPGDGRGERVVLTIGELTPASVRNAPLDDQLGPAENLAPAPADARDEESPGEASTRVVGDPPAGTVVALAVPNKRYQVQPGDTLMSIARKRYGGPQFWRWLVAANSGQLAGQDTPLASGMLLNVPAAKRAAAQWGDSGEGVSAPEEMLPAAYRVQEGETLYTIAEKVYGDSRRWQELLELNRDLLKTPQALSSGMVLRTEAVAPAAALIPGGAIDQSGGNGSSR